MNHLFKKGIKESTLILLHGTGGDEHSLLAIGKQIDEHMNVLSIRGNVIENGMNRFFKRKSPGVFDLVNLESETNNLKEFLNTAARQYHFSLSKAVVLGYSNGANIAINLLFRNPKMMKTAILLHPMIPQTYDEHIDFEGIEIFIGAGKNDPMVPYPESRELMDMFENRNAKVTVFFHQDGHQLTYAEIKEAHHFLKAVELKKEV
jgi:phospholipase/carboxylesterase